jgi:alcohol/geraniol dehydrogenase (NADP+)
MKKIRAWACQAPKERLSMYEYDPGELLADEVEIEVSYCGLCHSDLSNIDNDWGVASYPLVPGHEVIGRVVAVGKNVKNVQKGQLVGVGWFAESCSSCRQCIAGRQNLCPTAHATIIDHFGGFAERVRAEWQWVFPIPDGVDPGSAGPLLCAGITVFAPFLIHGIKPVSHVGVVGLGGLGHLAIKFARSWGCEVTAFTHSPAKFQEAKRLGAHQVVSSTDKGELGRMNGKLDMLLIAVNVSLDWQALIETLAPQGVLHVVGVVEKPIPVMAIQLISNELKVAGSPSGSPDQMLSMLEFAARHQIRPEVEHFPMSRVNDAIDHLRAGKPKYRVVLENDF